MNDEVKVGLISCSGEDFPEGTLSRTAVRLVLEKLRPGKTVTICLPLFLAGDVGERDFAKSFPTIAVDGCEKLCAKKGTEKYSGKVDDSINVRELLKKWGVKSPASRAFLDVDGLRLAERIAEEIAVRVDHLREKKVKKVLPPQEGLSKPSCACGSLSAAEEKEEPSQPAFPSGPAALSVKILGPGCPNCEKLYNMAREVISESGLPVSLEKVSKMQDIMKYRILATPGLVIGEEVASSGRLPHKDEIRKLIQSALAKGGK
ncbi:MAG: MTH895/ArsE family thioredoxin-like protein [bacterium]